MTTKELELGVRDALGHLYDPDYEPSSAMCVLLGQMSEDGLLAAQSLIRQAIDSLEPPDGTPASALAQRRYNLLHKRYVLGLTLEETAHQMHLSVTSTWRVQRAAIHAVTQVLWNRCNSASEATETTTEDITEPPEEGEARVQGNDWRSQARRELASLDLSSPGAVSDVAEIIRGVLNLNGLIGADSGVWLEVESVQPNLVAAIHPSALRQLLITAVRRLAWCGSAGPITVFGGLEDGSVRITLAATVAPGQLVTAHDLVGDIVAPEQVSLDVHVDGSDVSLRARMPSAEDSITVLVVDDNADMIHFHRRSMAGTRYRILPAARAEGIFEIIEAAAPDAIILDVMLPDVDGWELLTHLHNDPRTRSIPVVVCSVVRERELALSLGAARYLAKPVRRRDLIRVLDEVLPQA